MTCNVCSGTLQPAAKYCGRCGTPVGAAAQSRPTADRRVVTVLFACASGVAGVEVKIGAERFQPVIDRFWSGAVRAVSRFGGVVAQHSRDVVLAVFGIPTTRDDDGERAVRAAEEALAEVRRLAEADPDVSALGLRIGLATGMVVAAETRSLVQEDSSVRPVGFRVAGDAVVLAQRLAEAAEPGAVLLDGETHRATRQSFRFQEIDLPVGAETGSTRAPGEGRTLFRLSGRRSRTGRTGALEEPLIGRDPDLAALQANWQSASAGTPTIVAVLGEAGTGKTALVRKFLVGPALEGAVVRRVRCQSYQQDTPYALAASLLLALLGLPEDADPAVVAPALARASADLLPGMPDAATLLGRMLGLEGDEAAEAAEAAHGLMPQQARTAAFLAFADLLVAQARRKPLAIVVDDLQWADEASVAWLEPIIRRLAAESAAPLLAVLAGRPEGRFAEVLGSSGVPVRRLDLAPLAAEDALALAAYHLGSTPDSLPQRVRGILAEVVSRAAGNPFYLTEMVRSLEGTGMLARRGATWELEPAPAEWRLPTTVHAAVAARLDRLPASQRRIVQAAAVMGRRFDRGLLRAVAAADEAGADVDALLADLVELGIFEEGTGANAGPGSLAFGQALIQEVAYGSLVEGRRRDLHRRVGLALEEKTGQSTVRFSPTLAQHFAQAGDADRSARYHAKAGDRARSAYANAEARNCYRAALDWLDRSTNSAALPPREDLLLNLALVETSLGNYDEALRLLDARWDIAPESTRALRARGDLLERKGDMAGALAAYRKAIVLSNNDGLESSRAMAAQANVRRRLGDFPEAIQMCRTALSCLAGMGMPAEAAYVHGVMGICYQRMGELEAALREHSAALRLREEAGDAEGVASSLNNLGIVSAWLGRVEDADGHYRRSLEMYRRLCDRASIGDVLNNLGDLMIKQGRYAEAESHLAEALAIARGLGHTPTTIVVLGNLADAALARGEAAEALQRLEEAIDLVYATGHTEVMAEVRLLRGRALAILGRAEEAAEELGEARSLAASASHAALFEEVERQARELGLEPAPRTG